MLSQEQFLEQFYKVFEDLSEKSLTLQTIYKDLDEWDSLIVLSIIVHFEQNFQIVIPPQLLFDCNTFEELYNSIINA